MQLDSSNAVLAAAIWLETTLLGTLATSVAIIAVAAFGFQMLVGRLDPRRGVTVLIGCFLVFGATSIAAGIRSMVDVGLAPAPIAARETPLAPPFAEIKRGPKRAVIDPYAGASVPQ